MSTSVCGLAHRRVTTRKGLLVDSSFLHTTTIMYTTNRLVVNLLTPTRGLPFANSTVLFLFSEY